LSWPSTHMICRRALCKVRGMRPDPTPQACAGSVIPPCRRTPSSPGLPRGRRPSRTARRGRRPCACRWRGRPHGLVNAESWAGFAHRSPENMLRKLAIFMDFCYI
jgi:hypothetical protein